MQRLDLTGQRFGRLTVLECLGANNKGRIDWKCACVCGKEVVKYTAMLRSGKARSCGCYQKEVARAHTLSMTRHGNYSGGRPTAEWSAWAAMRARCTVVSHAFYPAYGGRGITVCERWQIFENFLADMGARPGPGYSIDRRKNELGYSPENCHWATSIEQNNNTRSNRMIELDGTSRSLAGWCRFMGIRRELFYQWRRKKDSDAAALREIMTRLA